MYQPHDPLEGARFEIEENVEVPPVEFQRQLHAGKNWSTRLSRLRQIPGVTCRIVTEVNDLYKDGYLWLKADERARRLTARIKRDLRRIDERERWSLSYRRMADHSYSIYATYEGRMDDREFEIDKVRRAQWALRFRSTKLQGRINREFQQFSPKSR